MRTVLPIAVLAVLFSFAGCKQLFETDEEGAPKKSKKVKRPAPGPGEEPGKPEEGEDPAAEAAPGEVPTREQGLKALAEARELLKSAEFAKAEPRLKVAAAAGIDGADKLLLKVRSEQRASDLFTSAKKKIAEGDLGGARADLGQIPESTAATARAKELIEDLAKREENAEKEMMAAAANKLAAPEPDAGAPAP